MAVMNSRPLRPNDASAMSSYLRAAPRQRATAASGADCSKVTHTALPVRNTRVTPERPADRLYGPEKEGGMRTKP